MLICSLAIVSANLAWSVVKIKCPFSPFFNITVGQSQSVVCNFLVIGTLTESSTNPTKTRERKSRNLFSPNIWKETKKMLSMSVAIIIPTLGCRLKRGPKREKWLLLAWHCCHSSDNIFSLGVIERLKKKCQWQNISHSISHNNCRFIWVVHVQEVKKKSFSFSRFDTIEVDVGWSISTIVTRATAWRHHH